MAIPIEENTNHLEIIQILAELRSDIKVLVSKLAYIETHLDQIDVKVQKHQSWIDQRQGQIILSIGLVTTGVTLGGLVMSLVSKFLNK